MYSEGPDGLQQVWKDGEIQEIMGAFLPVLEHCHQFIDRLKKTLSTMFQQLSVFYGGTASGGGVPKDVANKLKSFHAAHLQVRMSDLLSVAQ